ncbi:MAG: TadE/TadG family type IV pilus assembly protein, partial [Paracoccaceae bacterium]
MRARKRSLLNSAHGFWTDEKGSITIQVLTFSFLLLATTGMVLDSGRLYTQHSQMQAYTDQMSLAAANELDRTSDSIERAAAAVFGASGVDPLLRKSGIEVGEFEVAAVYFYKDMVTTSARPQNDMSETFPSAEHVATALPGGTINYTNGFDAATAPQEARYAVAQATEQATKSSLVGLTHAVLRMGSDPKAGSGNPGQRQGFNPDYSFGAVAAAGVDERYCAELSTLVFCNPWEDLVSDTTTNAFEQHPFDLAPSDTGYSLVGRSLMFFAANFPTPQGGVPVLNGNTEYDSAYAWDLPHQLFKLVDPIVDAGEICDVNNVPYLNSGEDYTVARDRCLMARAEADRMCWGSENPLTIQPAHGPDVARSINTAFDIWLAPFEDYISQADTPVASTGLSRHQFF